MRETCKRIRIVYVLDSLNFGGREKVVIDLANRLCREKFEVYVISFSNDSLAQAGLLKKDIKIICLPFRRSSLGGISALLFWVRGLMIYRSALRQIKPDIVHTHLLFQQFLFGSLGIRLSGTNAKHFHTVHTAGLYFEANGILNRIRLFTEKISVKVNNAYVIAVSEIVLEKCIRNFRKNAMDIRCIYNGVDELKFDSTLRRTIKKESLGFNKQDIVVTYVARIDEGKDHRTLLAAWREVIQQSSDARLCLIGEGPLESDLRSFVSRHGLNDSVVFMGYQPDVHLILAITDIGVFTSLFEGFGLAIIEKMMMKVPVIATNIPVVANLITDNENGMLFKPKDFDTLAQHLLLLITDKRLRIRLGEKACCAAQSYTLTNTIHKHEVYYVEAISS